ncbi:MAG: hypothetical protein ACI8PT_003780, partial [Gammaproteobacteria bacterium]
GSDVGVVRALQDGFIDAAMAFGRRDITDGAVAMLVVVPGHELRHPGPCLGEIGKRCRRNRAGGTSAS